MNLENRVSRLENRIGVGDNEPPLIVINATDCQKGSMDKGIPTIGVIPGKLGGSKGFTLTREKDEDPDIFLEKCEKKHAEFYV